MDYKDIIGNANRLKKNSLYKVTIADSTRELLQRINTNILNAHDAGLSKMTYKLPVNFRQIDNNVTNKELQTSIYYNIVVELERKGYEVSLKFSDEFTLISVAWTVRASESDIDSMTYKLMSLTK